MTVAIMQPYLFPYIGYWQLIANSDEFVFFDVVQYNKRSWMNRNRILHPSKTEDFQYISVPIKKHSQGTIIKDVYINNNENWKAKILGQLTVYKKLKAPYYKEVLILINKIFDKEHESFLGLSIESTKQVTKYLDIDFKYQIASDIDFDKSIVEGPGDWALTISKKLKVDNYINPFGGYEIFDEEKYNQNGIDIKFIKSNLTPYKQSWRNEFMAGLSIIDILMFNDKNTIKDMLMNDFNLLSKQDLINLDGK
jgi:hypothetical protein